MELKFFHPKQLPPKNAFSQIIQKVVDNNLSEEKTEHLIYGKSNYSVKFFTAHSTPIWPTPHLHNPPHPYMTHPIPPHPCMTHRIPPLWVIISQVWVIHKRLNVNWRKIHSLILSVTCHGLGNFPLLIHIPSYPFMNFWNAMSYYFLTLSHL